MRGVVYALFDPIDFGVRYVGRTTGTVRERICNHMSEVRMFHPDHDNAKRRWLRELLVMGIKPSWGVLEECDAFDLVEREEHWTNELRPSCSDLTRRRFNGGPKPWLPSQRSCF